MKKFVSMLLLVALLASCTIAFAASEFVEFKSTCYVYKKAGSGKTNVIIKRKSVVEKTGTSGSWTKIKFDDSEGYVRTKYVKKSSETEEKVVYSSGGSNKAKAGTEAEGTTDKKSAKTTGKVNLRKGASLDTKVLKVVKSGTTVTLTGKTKKDSRGVTFYSVKVGSTEGWISEKYLEIK